MNHYDDDDEHVKLQDLLDDDRCNDETFDVTDVGIDWEPSMTLDNFDKNEGHKYMTEFEVESNLMTVENLEKSIKEKLLIQNSDKKIHKQLKSNYPYNDRNKRFNNNKIKSKNQNYHQIHVQNYRKASEEKSVEEKTLVHIPYSQYVFPFTEAHKKNIIYGNQDTWIENKQIQNNTHDHNNLMINRDFDIILRIQLQQLAERPEIQSYSSKWNHRLLAKKHNIQIDKKNEHQKLEDKASDINIDDKLSEKKESKMKKFGRSSYSTVRGARELIKVTNKTKEINNQNQEEYNQDNNYDNNIKENEFNQYYHNTSYNYLTSIINEIVNDPNFTTDRPRQVPGPLIHLIIESGNDLLYEIKFIEHEIDNCPTGHIQAKIRLDQDLRDKMNIIYQLVLGIKVSNDMQQSDSTISNIIARKWLMRNIISIRKGQEFILRLLSCQRINDYYCSLLLESIISTQDTLVSIFNITNIVLPPLKILVPRVFRYRRNQNILAPQENIDYTGDVDLLLKDYIDTLNNNNAEYELRNLRTNVKLGIKILELLSMLSNKLNNNLAKEESLLLPVTKSLVNFYNGDSIQSLFSTRIGVVTCSLLYNSISNLQSEKNILNELTCIFVRGFTNYIVIKQGKNIIYPLQLSHLAFRDTEPVILCILQRSTSDPNLKDVLMKNISIIVGEQYKDSFIQQLQSLIVKGP